MTNREDIYSGLFNVVSAAASFVTKSRRVRLWGDVTADEQPALFMSQKPEEIIQLKGLPPKHILRADFIIYVKTGEEETTVPATILNPLIDAVAATLAPPIGHDFYPLVVNGQTISHCWIEGPIETAEGALGSQEVAVIPVKILAL